MHTENTIHEVKEMSGIQELKEHIKSNGLNFDPSVLDGSFQYFTDGMTKGWYVGSIQSLPDGRSRMQCTYNLWKGGPEKNFVYTSRGEFSEEELKILEEKNRRELEEEKEKRRQQQLIAAQEAEKAWAEATLEGESSYLKKKQIKGTHGAKFAFGKPVDLVIPARTSDGKLWALQTIDSEGGKRFGRNQKVGAAFFEFGSLNGSKKAYLAEGFATSATVHEVSGLPVACCFYALNLPKVAKDLKEKYPDIEFIVAGDDDVTSQGNPGRTLAEQAARHLNSVAIFPEFRNGKAKERSDFNDQFVLEGEVSVKATLERAEIEAKRLKRDSFGLLKLCELFSRPETPREYLVDGLLLSGATSIIGSKPKCGKTTLVRQLALAVAKGTPFFGNKTKKGAVIYIAVEEKEDEVKRHFKEMGADGSEDIYLFVAPAPSDILDKLRLEIHRLKPVLVILDTLMKVVRVEDSNNYTEIIKELEPLQYIARYSNCHLLCVHHLGKVEREGNDGFLGSTGISGAFDSLLIMNRKKEFRTIKATQRYGEDLEESRLLFDPKTRKCELGPTVNEDAQDAVKDEVYAVIAASDVAISQKVIQSEVQRKRGTITDALKRLVSEGLVIRSGKPGTGGGYLYGKNPSAPGPGAESQF